MFFRRLRRRGILLILLIALILAWIIWRFVNIPVFNVVNVIK